MASVLPFVHIDFAPSPNRKPDFSDVALRPGRAVLDDTNTNCYVLMRWLGPLVAEPDRKGSRVDFYLRDERSSRVPDAFCSVVIDADLDGELKGDLAEIDARLKAATPKNNNERDVLKYAIDEMAALKSEPRRKDRRFYFMKWRDARKKWHLVWCPGFARADSQPAVPVICTSKCQLYFLNRTNATPRCPECHGATEARKTGESPPFPWKRTAAAAVALIAAGLGIWWYSGGKPGPVEPPPSQPALLVTPETWTGPVDSQVQFAVALPGADGKPGSDVSIAARPVVDDPRIVKFDDFGLVAHAKSPGKTTITFTVGEHSRQIDVVVQPPTNPQELIVEPEKLEVAVDAQVPWTLKGRYPDGRVADLTSAAECPSRADAPFFVDRGLVRGLEPGQGTLTVRYRATPDSELMSREIPVAVVEKAFKSLELSVTPASLPVGEVGEISVTAIADDGARHQVTGTEKLELSVAPPSTATIEGRRLRGLTAGTARLAAKFRGLTADLDVALRDAETDTLSVHPKTLMLRVGEIADVQVVAAANPPFRIISSVPMNVEVSGRSRLIGRAVGTGEVQVVQGAKSVKLDVTVVAADFTGLSIDPAHLVVPVDDSKPLRVVAESPSGPRAEIAPDQLQWVTLPSPEVAQLDRQGPRLKGMQATSEPAELSVRFGELLARGQVEVTSSPLRLELSPAGTIELPVGQKLELKVLANYGEGRSVAVPAERVEWESDPIAGLRFESGVVEAARAGAGPLKVKAVYQGRTSNSVEVSSIEPQEVTLRLEAIQPSVSAGETGYLKLTGMSRSGPVQLSLEGVAFESGSPEVVAVDGASGAFRGHAAGKATLTARHPLVSTAASCEVTVVDGPANVASLRLVTDAGSPVRLPVGAIFSDYRVEAVNSEGVARDVTSQALLTLEGDPQPPPVAIQSGRIVAQSVGTARLKATFEGAVAPDGLDVEVVAELDIDELTIAPASLELAIGERAAARALGWKKGRIVGDITARPDLVWKSSAAAVAATDGPAISGLAEGRSSITVEVGGFTSKPMEVTITPVARQSRRLAVSPTVLTMGLDETRQIGADVIITRDGADVSDQCDVSTAAARNVVEYRRESGSLVAAGAGRGRVTFLLGGDSVSMDVRVEPQRRAITGMVRLVVEPPQLNLAVGQEASLRVFRVSDNGQRADVTAGALLSSSAETIAAVGGRGVLGVAAGQAQIVVRVSGVETPATVDAVVADAAYTSLEVVPLRVQLSVGERRTLAITGLTQSGRVRLGPHPDLKLTIAGAAPDAVRIEPGHTLFGAQAGAATVTCQWRDGPSKQVPVVVTADLLRDLVIEPSQATIAAGETIDFQVFARRGGSLVPLDVDDGIQLQVGNAAIASVEQGLRVRGQSRGVTEVIARAGALRARADLTVVTGSGSAQGSAPAALPVGLEFIPSSTRVELGYPGNRIRVIRILADGRQEDVDHLARLTVRNPQDQEVVSITSGPSGPLVAPRNIGQAQIDAELDGLRTRSPLLVDVVERLPSTASVRIVPSPLVIRNGQSGEFTRVEVIPATGSPPIELPFRVSATPNRIFRVEPDNRLVATEPGQAIATVTIVDPDGKYDGLYSSATVEVTDGSQPAGARLRLTGPSETSIGAEVAFLAELVGAGQSVDVTNTETTLVLQQDQADVAEVRPGCRLVARKPGRLTLQAKHRDQVSNVRTLVIRPLSEFARLELELETTSMHVGDSRPYKLWGHPRGGGARQDLTASVSASSTDPGVPQVALTVTLPDPGSQVAVHEPSTVIARQPGQFRLQGSLGSLTTAPVTITVSGTAPGAVQLKAEPSSLTLRVGETSAPVQIFARSRGDRGFRPVEAEWEPLNASIANVEPGAPAGRIKAVDIGQTQVRAKFGGLSTLVDVKVVGDRFRRLGEGKLVNVGKQTFSIELDVEGDRSESEIEYRFVRPGNEAAAWTKAQPAAEGIKVTLTSPAIKLGPPTELYQLMIEARDTRDKSIEHYPYSFRIVAGVTRVDQ